MGKYFIFKSIIILISLIIFSLSVYGLVIYFINGPFNEEYAKILYAPFIGIYLSTLLFYLGMYKGCRLISNLEKGKFYSISSVKHIGIIQSCASTITSIILIILPFVFQIADKDDAPGLIVINFILLLVFFIAFAIFMFLGRHVKEVIVDRETEKE